MPIDKLKKNQIFLFTVFTPTYNRAHLLPRVYNSLCKQTYCDFEWLIIDDGSMDGTADLINKWQIEKRFTIRYHYQENQGKHFAWNKAADLANGEYFLCADSDDEFVPESLQCFKECFESFSVKDSDKFYGASALCGTENGSIVGEKFPSNISASDFSELYFRHGIQGEKWNCGKTRIHREIRFEETFRNSYLPEGTVWLKIAKSYSVALINQPLRIYHSEPDSICHTFSFKKNAPGMLALSSLILNDYLEIYWNINRPLFFYNTEVYLRCCFHLCIPLIQQVKILKNRHAKALCMIVFPKALALFFYDKCLRSIRHSYLFKKENQSKS